MEFFGLEKLSLVDYDGKVATTIFTGTCNFKCGFCHNGPLVTDTKNLKSISQEKILDYVKSRKNILDGICITGGEPTLHKDLPDFCKKLKDIGILVKLDTNGTNPEMIKNLLEDGLCDYVAMDIKNSKEDYAPIIGLKTFSTANVEKSVEYLINSHYDYEFRTTLIKEYHTEKNMEDIGKWIKGAKKYMLQKFKEIDTCLTLGLHEVDIETAKKFKNILIKYIPNTMLRGYDWLKFFLKLN